MTQNTRFIRHLGSAIGKMFNIYFCLLQQPDPKENPFCKWVSRREDTQIWVMPLLHQNESSLLETIGLLETYFGFGISAPDISIPPLDAAGDGGLSEGRDTAGAAADAVHVCEARRQQ